MFYQQWRQPLQIWQVGESTWLLIIKNICANQFPPENSIYSYSEILFHLLFVFSLEHQYSPKLVRLNFTNQAQFQTKNVVLGMRTPYTTIIIIQKDVDLTPASEWVF